MLTLWVDCLKAFTEHVAEPRESETDATIETRKLRPAGSTYACPVWTMKTSWRSTFSLCLLVAQIAQHQQRRDGGDAGWVSMGAVEALSQRLGHLGAAAVELGWRASASERGVLDVREGSRGPQVRLKPAVPGDADDGQMGSIRRLLLRLVGRN